MLPLNPARIPALYKEAMKHLAAGRRAEARALLERILAVNPRFAEAQFQLGRVALAEGKPDEACAAFARAAALKPHEAAIWRSWAEAAAKGGAAASTDLLRAARKARLPEPLMRQVEAALAPPARPRPSTGGAPPEALKAIVAALEKDRFAEAAAKARALLARYPSSAPAHAMLAAAEGALGRLEAAEAAHRKAIALAPDYAEGRANFGRFLVERGRLEEGIAELREAVRLSPRLGLAWGHLALALERMGNTDTAAEAAKRALALGADGAETRLVLARCQMAQAEPEPALKTLAPLLSAKAPPLEALLLRAEALALLDRTDEAIAACDAAIGAAPDSPAPLAEKARLMQRLGRFDEAEALFRAAIAKAPEDGRAFRIFMASHRATADDPLIAEMERRWEDPAITGMNRAEFGFALAKAMEDIGAYDKVFTYLRPANAIIRERYPFDRGALRRDLDAIMEACAALDFSPREIEGASDYAPIFVAGLPRSGTTLVESILAAHSAVTAGGELGLARGAAARLVFGTGGKATAPLTDAAIAAAGREAEAAMRARFPAALRLTDKSVQTHNFLGLIRLMLPRAALVVVERDPRDSLLSMYRNLFAFGRHRYAYDLDDLAFYWREYRRIMRFWRERMPGGYHVVRYEDLVADPEAQARALIAACGLEWEDACLDFHKTKRRVDTLSLHQVRQPIYRSSMKAWERYADEIAPLLEAIEEIEAEEAAHGQ
jgi:tetratricopeptide (TPR) repeat protein